MTDKDEIYQSEPSEPYSESAPTERRQVFTISLALGIGVALIYLAFLKPGIWGIDGNDMFWVSYSLVTEGDFSTGKAVGVLGSGGEYYSIRYLLLPVLATPFVAFGVVAGNILGLPVRYTATLCALVLPVLLTALTTSLVALLAIRLGSSKKSAYLAALSYAFGTTALVYSREFFAEPLLALLTTASIYFALGNNARQHAMSSLWAGLAIPTKPAGIVLAPLLSLYFFYKKYPWRTIIGPWLSFAMGVGFHLWYTYVRFENLSGAGPKDRLQLQGMPERLIGLLISPGAGGGLFWYCPPTILAIIGFWALLNQSIKRLLEAIIMKIHSKPFQIIRSISNAGFWMVYKKKPLEALLILGIFLGYLVLHSFWAFRGWNWGPRFLVPILPALLAVVAVLEKKWWKALLVLTLIGFFWNAPTLVAYYQRYYAEAIDNARFYQVLAYSPWGPWNEAPLFNIWGATFRQLSAAFSSDVAQVLKGVGEPPVAGNLASSDLLRIVAVWWWVLPAAGIPIWVGFAIATIMVGLGIWILRRGWINISDQ
jgi:hypothetical protein